MTVVFIMIDGVRPDGLQKAATPTLDAIMKQGSYTLAASSVMPTITMPCHMSIFHSVPAARHGIIDNEWHMMQPPITGLIEQAKAADRRCAFFYNWEPLRGLSRPGSLAFAYFVDTAYEIIDTKLTGDQIISAVAADYLAREQYDFAFIYFGATDLAGHLSGWMSEPYLAQIEIVDGLIAQVLAVLNDHDTVLIQADHGGHERGHGTDKPEDMLIPWMMRGPQIRQNYLIQQQVTLLDTAPTLARLLDIPLVPEWEGRVIDEIFIR